MKKATMYFSFSHNQSCFSGKELEGGGEGEEEVLEERLWVEGLRPDLAHPQLEIEIEKAGER